MKKNNLLKTVLLFLFAVLLLQGCRSENIMDTNKSEYTYTHIVSKEVKSLKDVPIFKAFIDDNKNEGQLKSLSKKISGENNIVVIIKKPNRVSYSTIILSGKNSFTILVYCIDDKNNKNAFLAEHNSKNELKEINLNNFTGNICYKKMNGESLGKINMINGQPEITSRNTKTSTVDCYYEPTLTAIRCTAGGNHYPGQVCGGTADQQPYWDVSFLLKCQQTQDQLYNDIGGGDYGSGSNPALTLFGADAINYMLSQIGMTHLNPDQYSFLTSHPTIADYFKTFFWGGNQNIDGANFLYWGINFFMQNPNTSWTQFQNWFMNADGTSRITFDSSVNASNGIVVNSADELNSILNYKPTSIITYDGINQANEIISNFKFRLYQFHDSGVQVFVKTANINQPTFKLSNVTVGNYGISLFHDTKLIDKTDIVKSSSDTSGNTYYFNMVLEVSRKLFIQGIGTYHTMNYNVAVFLDKKTGKVTFVTPD